MASKGKKTEHVIQDTGEMEVSESEYAMLVASGVTRPCHPHEIELKHLSAEEIAQGRWTDKQKYDYLMYMQDFCRMPDNEPSIFISQVSKYDTKKRILFNFKAQKLGVIENIDLFPLSKDTLHNRAFVHFKDWNTYYMDTNTFIDSSTYERLTDDFITKNENAIRTRFALITGKTMKLYYDKHDKSAFVEIMALRPEHLE